MTVSSYQLGYKNLSKIILEWQAADKASLLALFITIEVATHWLWCLLVWLRQDALHGYVNIYLLYPLWFGITLAMLFFWWMVGHLSRIKNNDADLKRWQVVLLVPYTIYLTVVIVMMGYSSLFAGVSLVGGAMLGMMLIKRQYIWYMFLAQVLIIVMAIISPYFGILLPNLRHLTITYPMFGTFSDLTYNDIMIIENTIAASIFKNEALSWENVNQIQRSATFFWRLTHVYLALPKAIFIVYAFRTLLLIIDDSKREIVKYANQDELTALNNRRYGLTQMQDTLLLTTDAQDYSLILLDLDFFKAVNDGYGHEVGDQVLREVAEVLSSTLAEKAIVSRYGGEEFLIILPDTRHSEAMATAECLRQSIAQHAMQIPDTASFNITASFGLYTLTYEELTHIREESIVKQPRIAGQRQEKLSRRRLTALTHTKPVSSPANIQLPSDICQSLIRVADKALYKAKDRGRNQVVSANDLLAAGLINTIIIDSHYGT